jgi:hypothetical protein
MREAGCGDRFALGCGTGWALGGTAVLVLCGGGAWFCPGMCGAGIILAGVVRAGPVFLAWAAC